MFSEQDVGGHRKRRTTAPSVVAVVRQLLTGTFRDNVSMLFISTKSKVQGKNELSRNEKGTDCEGELQALRQVDLEFRCTSKLPCKAVGCRSTVPVEAS